MVEQARAEQHGPVLAIGHDEAVPGLLFQKCYNPLPVGIVVLDLPIVGRRRAADDQAAAPGIEVGFRRRDPEIDADGGIVGMDVDGRLRPQALEGPGLGQRMRRRECRETRAGARRRSASSSGQASPSSR